MEPRVTAEAFDLIYADVYSVSLCIQWNTTLHFILTHMAKLGKIIGKTGVLHSDLGDNTAKTV